jgi:hypothetical protein
MSQGEASLRSDLITALEEQLLEAQRHHQEAEQRYEGSICIVAIVAIV